MSKLRYQPLGPLLSGEGSRAFLGLQISNDAPPLAIILIWVPEDVAREPDAVAKITRETKRAISLTHPNIVRVHGLASLNEGLARVVEFVDGESLRTVLDRCRKLPPSLAALVTADAAMGAHYAHLAGDDHAAPLVHGDIRPETLLVSFTGVCKVGGYGALGVAPKERDGRRVPGRRYHSAPEQVVGGRDAINRQTDVYLLGLVLYECLTGIIPFKEDPDFDLAVLNRPFPSLLPEEVPPDLIRVVEKATAKKAAQRYSSARALRDAIEKAVGMLPAHEELATFLRKYYPDNAPARLARFREIEAGIAELARKEGERSTPAAPPAPASEAASSVLATRQRSIATYAMGTALMALIGISSFWLFGRAQSDGGGAPKFAADAVPSSGQDSSPPTRGAEAESANPIGSAATTPPASAAGGGAGPEVLPTAAAASPIGAPVEVRIAKPLDLESAAASEPVANRGSLPAEETSLQLTIEPPVEVVIDGRAVGRSPVSIAVAPGKHTVQMIDAGHKINATRAIKVSAKGRTSQHIVLGKGLVQVTAPDGAVISIDGQSVGSAPVNEISVYEGKHRIQATLGGAKWQKSFSLGVNERMFFNIETTAQP